MAFTQNTSTFYYIGLLTSLYLLSKLTNHIYIHFLRPSSLDRYLHHNHHRTTGPTGSKNGKETQEGENESRSWALITGSTDGIGLAFAHELCARGFNVFLHGRNRNKLLKVQEQLALEYPSSKTKIIVFDAASGPLHDVDRIADEIGDDDDAHLTVLINNVGGVGGTRGVGSRTYRPL